jgi:uncharacterized protein with GYD domain
MATYLMTFSFTDQGIQQIKESPGRVDAAKKTIQAMGGEVRAFYAILGADYDTIFIVEAPNEETIAGMALAISSLGNVHTSTHRAFSEEDFRKIVTGLP